MIGHYKMPLLADKMNHMEELLCLQQHWENF